MECFDSELSLFLPDELLYDFSDSTIVAMPKDINNILLFALEEKKNGKTTFYDDGSLANIYLNKDYSIRYLEGRQLNQDDLQIILFLLSKAVIEANGHSVFARISVSSFLKEIQVIKNKDIKNINGAAIKDMMNLLLSISKTKFELVKNNGHDNVETYIAPLLKAFGNDTKNMLIEFDLFIMKALGFEHVYPINKKIYFQLKTKLSKYLYLLCCKTNHNRLQMNSVSELIKSAGVSKDRDFINNTLNNSLEELLSFGVIESFFINKENKTYYFIPTRDTMSESKKHVVNSPNIVIEKVHMITSSKKKNFVKLSNKEVIEKNLDIIEKPKQTRKSKVAI